MSRTTINFILDFCLLITFLLLVWTSALLQFVLPQATPAGTWTLWGMDYDAWHRVQSGCLAVLMLGILLHLVLHWAWVCGFIAARMSNILGRRITTNEATRTLYGVSMLALILMALGALLTLGQIMIRGPLKP